MRTSQQSEGCRIKTIPSVKRRLRSILDRMSLFVAIITTNGISPLRIRGLPAVMVFTTLSRRAYSTLEGFGIKGGLME